jgi:hypothetical protein
VLPSAATSTVSPTSSEWTRTASASRAAITHQRSIASGRTKPSL